MKLLSGLDASFLHLETPEMPMHVGGLDLFGLPAGYAGDFHEAVKAHIMSRMHLASIFSKKLALMPFESRRQIQRQSRESTRRAGDRQGVCQGETNC